MIDLLDLLNDTLRSIEHTFEDGEIISIAINGAPIKMVARDKKVANWIRIKYPHEPATSAAFIALCGKFRIGTIFDIGAHFGYFTQLAGALIPDGQVFAFEMNPSFYKILQGNIAASGLRNVICRKNGISNRSATTRASISGFTLKEGAGWHKLGLIALDDFDPQPDLIKMDVEGYQAKAVPGMLNMLRRAKPFMIAELDKPERMMRFSVSNAQVFQPLLDMGYEAYWCSDHRSAGGGFERIKRFEPCHEINSLMVFAHRQRVFL